MTFDDLQHQWQASNEQAAPTPIDADKMLRTWRRIEKSNFSLFRRDLVETLAAIFVIGFFGKAIFSLPNWIAKSGAIVCVCGALYVIYRLHRARRVQGESRPELSVREYFQIEIQRVENQIHLIRTIASWYIVPLLLGANLVFAGASPSLTATIVYFFVTVLLGWGIYWLNQRAIEKHFAPLYEELTGQQKELEDPNNEDLRSNT